MPVLGDALTILVGLVGGFLLGGWVAWVLFRRRRSQRARARSLTGNQAEERAAILLKERGFQILEHPCSLPWTYWVDGEAQSSTLRADFRVERDGKGYLVEVKSTRRAGVATLPETRRQLLEYSRAFGGPVPLLCTETESLAEVSFAEDPGPEEGESRQRVFSPVWWWIGVSGWAAALALLGLRWLGR